MRYAHLTARLLLTLLGGCALQGRSTATVLSQNNPAEPAPSAYSFPERTALPRTLEARPAPTAVFTEDVEVDAPWVVDEKLPELPEAALHETETPAGQLIVELASERAEVSATDGAACLAREVARHSAAFGRLPSDARRSFAATRCGVVSPVIELHGRTWQNVPTRMAAARFWSEVQGDIRTWMNSSLPSERAHVGVHLARHEQTVSVALVIERPRAQLGAVRPMPNDAGNVIVRGRLLTPAASLRAFINHGPVGVRPCQSQPGLTLPDFALTCPMADGNQVAGIDVIAHPPGRALGEPAAQLLARRSEEAARVYVAPDVGEPALVTDPAAFTPLITQRVNQLRAANGLRPLRLAESQGAALTPAMPFFFDPNAESSVQDLIALTMLAGWEVGGAGAVSGTIADAVLAGHESQSPDAAQWLARCLDRPMMRATLMGADSDMLAIAPLVEAGGIAAMVAAFQFYDPARDPHGAAADAVFGRIRAERAARGLPPPTRVANPSGQLAAEVDTVRTRGKAPNHVLQAALSRASSQWRRDVRGVVAHIAGDPHAFEVPPEFLGPGPLHVQAASTFHQAPGAPWGQWLVVLVSAN